MSFDNSSISGQNARNAINAFLFAEANDTPLTAFFTVAWELISDFQEDSIGLRLGKVLHGYARWCRDHETACAYIRVMERSDPRGIHTHFFFHVSERLFSQLVHDFPNWIDGYKAGPMVHFGNERDNPDPKFHGHANQRRGRLRYMLKGLSQKACINRDGTRVRIAELLQIHADKGPQGQIGIKRVGVSHSLGRVNRLRHRFLDVTAFDDLGAAIATQRGGDPE